MSEEFKVSEEAVVISWWLSSIIKDNKKVKEIDSACEGLSDAIVEILCSHTDLRVHISENHDRLRQENAELREMLQQHRRFCIEVVSGYEGVKFYEKTKQLLKND